MPTASNRPIAPKPITDDLNFEVHDSERPILWNAYRGRQLMGIGHARTQLGAAIQMRRFQRKLRREEGAR